MPGTAADLSDPAGWPRLPPATWSPPADRWLAGEADERRGYRFERRRGAGTALLLATRGGCGRLRVPGADLRLEAGDVVVLGPGCPHAYGVPADADRWRFAWVHAPHGSSEVPPCRLVRTAGRHPFPEILLAMERIAADLARGRQLSWSLASAAWSEIALRLEDASGSGADGLVTAVRETVLARLDRPWPVAAMAAEAGLSPSRFAHRFTEAVGSSPHDWLQQRRLARAADLLAATDLSVAAVAERCGFSSPFWLSRAFRAVHGKAPRAWRTALRAAGQISGARTR
ncbi:MAG: hypothetical protein RL456_3447 [Pseudomonadota bacterium]|jgi:AraC family transcriptional regulator of arabinose operon